MASVIRLSIYSTIYQGLQEHPNRGPHMLIGLRVLLIQRGILPRVFLELSHQKVQPHIKGHPNTI